MVINDVQGVSTTFPGNLLEKWLDVSTSPSPNGVHGQGRVDKSEAEEEEEDEEEDDEEEEEEEEEEEDDEVEADVVELSRI